MLFIADTSAMNNIQTSAVMAPTASFKTIRPIKQNAPKKPSILGPILGGISTGISAGSAIGGEGYWSGKMEDWGWSG